jgi:acyl-CoA reductase-like NAD-dependent aldehyde dehydrogenase
MTVARHRLWIAGSWQDGKAGSPLSISSPYSGSPVAQTDQASEAQIQEMLQASEAAFRKFRRISRHARSRLLSLIAQGLAERRTEIADVIAREAGKPWTLADGEVGRALVTFTLAAEETKRWGGEILPVDVEPAGRAYSPALVQWVARGPVLAIAPFNFPLNLIAHKVAPALASGCTLMVKPPPQAPGAARILAEIFAKAAEAASDSQERIPAATLQVFSCSNELASRAVTDPRVSTVSFTGSERVGWLIQEKAVKKRVILELGGNAGVIVHSDADLARAAARCAFGGFAYAGQVCISVQRVFVQKNVAAKFQELFLKEVSAIVCGDPARKDVLVGPLIDTAAADRVTAWIDEAVKAGAKAIAGGKREGNLVPPTVLTGVRKELKLSCEEVFGPVVILDTYAEFDEALERINESHYGLQAGVFTDSARLIRQAFDTLEVGGLLINEVPTYRSDNMPYGGVKDSGLGREGIKYAMEQYSERRAMIAWHGGTTIG